MKRKKFLSVIWQPVLAAAVLMFFLNAVANVRAGQQAEGKQQLEDALRRTATACYAAEGIYPPNLNYMQEHYGIRIDEERYTVVYDVIGSNLMPDITVLEHGHE